MATTTTRLGLRKPAATDLVTVTTDINASMDKLDAAIGVTFCTSTTRPSTPFIGMEIKETDTHKSYAWSSTAWSEIGESLETGLTALSALNVLKAQCLGGQNRTGAANPTVGTTEKVLLTTASLVMDANSDFILLGSIRATGLDSTSEYTLSIKKTNTAGLLIGGGTMPLPVAGGHGVAMILGVYSTGGAAENNVFVATIARVAGSGAATNNAPGSALVVLKVGPVGTITSTTAL